MLYNALPPASPVFDRSTKTRSMFCKGRLAKSPTGYGALSPNKTFTQFRLVGPVSWSTQTIWKLEFLFIHWHTRFSHTQDFHKIYTQDLHTRLSQNHATNHTMLGYKTNPSTTPQDQMTVQGGPLQASPKLGHSRKTAMKKASLTNRGSVRRTTDVWGGTKDLWFIFTFHWSNI